MPWGQAVEARCVSEWVTEDYRTLQDSKGLVVARSESATLVKEARGILKVMKRGSAKGLSVSEGVLEILNNQETIPPAWLNAFETGNFEVLDVVTHGRGKLLIVSNGDGAPIAAWSSKVLNTYKNKGDLKNKHWKLRMNFEALNATGLGYGTTFAELLKQNFDDFIGRVRRLPILACNELTMRRRYIPRASIT